MARKPQDVIIQLRCSAAERALINKALGRGHVNSVAVDLLLAEAHERLATQPGLDEETTTAA